MTDKTIRNYYKQNRERYKMLSQCTSVNELMLKLAIYGKKWLQLDWALFFSYFMSMLIRDDAGSCRMLYADVIETIDNSDTLDPILTNKQVVLAIIAVMKSCDVSDVCANNYICCMLAHMLKKHPSMWNLSWMYAKRYNAKTFEHAKRHRLADIQHGTSTGQLQTFIDTYMKI